MPRPPRIFNDKKYYQKLPPYQEKTDADSRAESLRKHGHNARVIRAKPGSGKVKGVPWLYLVYARKIEN